jgi:hypothetical protein
MYRLRTDEWAARQYEGYCEIWQTQRKHLSPEFLRGIATHAISLLVSVRRASVADEFSREQQRTGTPRVGWLQPAMDGFARAMTLLLNKWEQACEFDARTVQYMLESAPEDSSIKRAAWEVISARARIRTLEAMIASIEARIEMAERALNGMLMAETPPYRKASVEQSLSRLKDERKELRASLDDWQLRLRDALRHADEAAERAKVRISQVVSISDLSEEERKADHSPVIFSHSEEYNSITFNGERHTLQPRQAAVVKLLHEALKKGHPAVTTRKIMSIPGCEDVSSVRDIFKSRLQLWGTLVINCENSSEGRGFYRLHPSITE